MKRRWLHAAVAALLAALGTACVSMPPGPRYGEVAARLPPVPPDRARFYFYRDYEPYESLARPEIYLNGRPTGASIPGGVYYRDLAPGEYRITVDSPGLYPDQFKTVTVAPGDTRYVKIESLHSWQGSFDSETDTFVVVVTDAARARSEIETMVYGDDG